jgi:hypothetical protein
VAPSNGHSPDGRQETRQRVVVLAYIMAVAVPPLGLILGAWIALRYPRSYRNHGVAVIGLAVVAAIIWTVIIASGAFNTTTTDY